MLSTERLLVGSQRAIRAALLSTYSLMATVSIRTVAIFVLREE